MIVFDGHCDSVLDTMGLSFTFPGEPARNFYADTAICHVDLPKLKKAGITCQTMALFTSGLQVLRATEHVRALSNKVDALVAAHDDLVQACSAGDVRRAKNADKTALMKSIEGGEAIGTDLGLLEDLYRRGIRIFGLTHNGAGPIGRGSGAYGNTGLTEFGCTVNNGASLPRGLDTRGDKHRHGW